MRISDWSSDVCSSDLTASGKSHLALGLARRDPTWELVSADSMQVYRGMDIGAAKPTLAEQADVPHHAIVLLDPWEDCTVVHYQRVAREAIAGLLSAEHTTAIQSLMRISYAVYCLNKKIHS